MSLRHLYIDLNHLGVYPDLIYKNRSGTIDNVMITSSYKYRYTNKYYGEIIRTFNNISSSSNIYSRLMYRSDVPDTRVYCNGQMIIFYDNLTLIIKKDKGCNWYLHHFKNKYFICTRNNIISGDLAVQLLRMRKFDVHDVVRNIREMCS